MTDITPPPDASRNDISYARLSRYDVRRLGLWLSIGGAAAAWIVPAVLLNSSREIGALLPWAAIEAVRVATTLAAAGIGFYAWATSDDKKTDPLQAWLINAGWVPSLADDVLLPALVRYNVPDVTVLSSGVPVWGPPAGDGNFRYATGFTRPRSANEGDLDVMRVHFLARRTRRDRFGRSVSAARTATVGVVALRLPGQLPHFHLTPEGLDSARARATGKATLDVELARFNEMWHVESDAARYAHAVLGPLAIDALSGDGSLSCGHIIIHRGHLLSVVADHAHVATTIGTRVRTLQAFAAAIPPFVYDDYRPSANPLTPGQPLHVQEGEWL